MLIREFRVDLYGPVRGRSAALAPGFNLLHGNNEAGKTLTIDALVKLLLGRQAREKEFSALQRVEGSPEGYVVVENGQGEAFKLPGKELADVVGLSPAECAGIFIIRNSDLSISRESEFYTTVTDRLTGLRTEEIAAVKRILCAMADITPTGQFRNVGDDKLKSRLDDALALAGRIDELHTQLLDDGFDELEKEQVDCSEELSAVAGRLEALEEARQRQNYEKGKTALDRLLQAREKLHALERFSAADERVWADSARDMHRLKQELARLQAGLGEKEQRRRELGRALQEKQRAFRLIENRKKAVDDEIRPGLKHYAARKEALARQETRSRLFAVTAAAAAVLLALSIAGALFRPGPFFHGFAVIAALAAAVSWLFLHRLARSRGAVAAALERIKAELSRHGLSAGSEEAVHRAVESLAEEHAAEQAAVNSLEGEAELLAREVAALRDAAMPGCERELAEAAQTIASIKRKAGEDSLQQYAARLKEKTEAEQLIAARKSVLESIFGDPASGDDANIAAWTGAVDELAAFKEKAPGLAYDDKTVSALKERQRLLEEKRTAVGYRMEKSTRELREIERKANQALQCDADYLHCQTTGDLLAVKERLVAFVEEHRQRKDDALQAVAIFTEIENEEKARVAELFGDSSPVSGHFRDITGGLYESVFYEREPGVIMARRRDGVVLAAEKLSGGAYDQLYLSIRLALAEQLLKEETGFLIMDDPFIKSDKTRLRRQLQSLLQIAARGWQVIYFSAKEEIREALQPEIEAGAVSCLPVGDS